LHQILVTSDKTISYIFQDGRIEGSEEGSKNEEQTTW